MSLSTLSRAFLLLSCHAFLVPAVKTYSTHRPELWAYISMALWPYSIICTHALALSRVRSSDLMHEKALQIYPGVLGGLGVILFGRVIASSPEAHPASFGKTFIYGGYSVIALWPLLHVLFASLHSNLRDDRLRRKMRVVSTALPFTLTILLCVSLPTLSCLLSVSDEASVYQQCGNVSFNSMFFSLTIVFLWEAEIVIFPFHVVSWHSISLSQGVQSMDRWDAFELACLISLVMTALSNLYLLFTQSPGPPGPLNLFLERAFMHSYAASSVYSGMTLTPFIPKVGIPVLLFYSSLLTLFVVQQGLYGR